jgi:aspartyl-tRNA(Asn)/glutamyl-tRNA(Gln) amidotransferase subunit A
VKDNFCTLEVETTASSNILRGFTPPYEATVVRKIRGAGAVIIGKTNMDAFAHGSSTETSDFGLTRNPHDTAYLAGGSSGGSAAAVAADECLFAIGSETAGSIRGPAAWCGVVGLKPTYGRVSRYGLIAMCSSTDCPGPITKTVADARLVYQVIKGEDLMDAPTSEGSNQRCRGIRGRRGVRIGLPREYFRPEAQKGVNEAVLAAAKTLEKKGAKISDVSLMDPQYAVAVYTIIQRAEVSSNLARFDGVRYGQTRICFNAENRRRIMLGTFVLRTGYYDAYYKQAQKVRTLIVEDFEKIFKGVDLLLAPTMPTVAPKIGVAVGQAMYGELADILTEASSLAGLPAISVPCGKIGRLPIGVQFIGPKWSEEALFDIAEKYEISAGYRS